MGRQEGFEFTADRGSEKGILDEEREKEGVFALRRLTTGWLPSSALCGKCPLNNA